MTRDLATLRVRNFNFCSVTKAILCKRDVGDGLPDASRYRATQPLCNTVVPTHTGDALLKDLGEIGAHDHLCILCGHINCFGPAAPADHVRQASYVGSASARGEHAVEQATEAHRARRFPRLLERHGMHANPTDAPGSAMRDLIFLRRRRARENPHPARSTRAIDGMPNRIPDGGGTLPLINDVRLLARKRKRRISPDRIEVAATVHKCDAFRLSERRPRLPAPLGTRNFNRTKEPQIAGNLRINDTLSVLCRLL